MGAVTYPNEKVIHFIKENMVPIQVLFNEEPLAKDFGVKWTPTIVTLDATGKEHHKTVGFLSPEEFIPSLLLGIGKIYFNADKFDEAISRLENILTDYPKSAASPEAIYIRGVCFHKKNHDPKALKAAYEKLQAEFPDSEWTKRAYPYRLL